MKNKAQYKSNAKEFLRDDGFVLPYVILVIAILSISVILLGERLQNVTGNTAVIENEFNAELALLNAESEATYAILTGKPMRLALDVNPLTPHKVLDILVDENSRREEEVPPDLWSASGGVRIANRADYPVVVELRDVSGLIPLNSDTDLVKKILTLNGISVNRARGLTAKLRDYIDLDSRRQFLGAERTEYRLRRLPPPSNAPLRNFDELSNVLGWNDVFQDLDLYKVMDITTLHQGRGLSTLFMLPELREAMDDELEESEEQSDLNSIFQNLTDPSGTYRLSLWVDLGGRYKKRVLEITKQSTNLISPFKSVLVYERTLESIDEKLKTTGLKDVIYTIPDTQ